MNARAIAFGVLAAATLLYAGIAVVAFAIVVAASPDDRVTLIMATVLALLAGLAVAPLAGLTLAPAYFIERRFGGGALPYAAWGAMISGVLAWRVLGEDITLVRGGGLIVLAFVAAGAVAGLVFRLGVRRGLRTSTSER